MLPSQHLPILKIRSCPCEGTPKGVSPFSRLLLGPFLGDARKGQTSHGGRGRSSGETRLRAGQRARSTRKGYAASVRRQSRQRLRRKEPKTRLGGGISISPLLRTTPLKRPSTRGAAAPLIGCIPQGRGPMRTVRPAGRLSERNRRLRRHLARRSAPTGSFPYRTRLGAPGGPCQAAIPDHGTAVGAGVPEYAGFRRRR